MTTSINTNTAAYVALQSLNSTSSALTAAQKQISTGLRVADASDDGGAFAVAQQIRSDVGALTTVNQQLGHASGLVGTASAALNTISGQISQAKSLLVDIGDQTNSNAQRAQYVATFNGLVSQVADTVDGSSYGGQTLLGSASGAVAGTSKTVINNESGSTTTISAEDNSGTAAALASLIGETFTRNAAGQDSFTGGPSTTPGNPPTPPTDAALTAAQGAAQAALSATGAGSFAAIQTANGNQLNQIGIDTNYLSGQETFNSNKIDSLNTGLGALVDANLSQESAVLQSLQIKQQLGTQALSIANQAPQALLSLFK